MSANRSLDRSVGAEAGQVVQRDRPVGVIVRSSERSVGTNNQGCLSWSVGPDGQVTGQVSECNSQVPGQVSQCINRAQGRESKDSGPEQFNECKKINRCRVSECRERSMTNVSERTLRVTRRVSETNCPVPWCLDRKKLEFDQDKLWIFLRTCSEIFNQPGPFRRSFLDIQSAHVT